jgi:capsular polysaccharide biosynthesis protein
LKRYKIENYFIQFEAAKSVAFSTGPDLIAVLHRGIKEIGSRHARDDGSDIIDLGFLFVHRHTHMTAAA